MSKDERRAAGSGLARAIEDARQSERTDIARDLHDTVIQPLAALVTSLESLKQPSVTPAVMEAYVSAWSELAREAISSLRCALGGLRAQPQGELGLPEALHRYLLPQARSQGIRLTLESREWAADLPADWTSSLYLLVREALTNVQKHARATEVTILLHADEAYVHIIITDNGVGFCMERLPAAKLGAAPSLEPRAGFGIVGMRERATLLGGDFMLDSAPGQGVRVEIRVPRQREEAAAGAPDRFVAQETHAASHAKAA
ncbi:MAG: sensor histidine kinase [Ktedonobacterales bacterium]